MPHPEQWLHAAIAKATGAKAWPLAAPEGLEPPFVVYRRQATERDRTLLGQAGGPVGGFDVEVFSDGYLAAKDLAELVRLEVDTFKGTESGVTIERVELADERDGEAVYFEGRDKPTYSVIQTYRVRWIETTNDRSR